jgi:hypothetical protein
MSSRAFGNGAKEKHGAFGNGAKEKHGAFGNGAKCSWELKKAFPELFGEGLRCLLVWIRRRRLP